MDWMLFITSIIGTIAFAVSGSLTAIERGLDLFGVLFIGCVAATGGGLMRDIVIATIPPSVFMSPEPLLVSTVSSFLTFCAVALFRKSYYTYRDKAAAINNVFDAIGLAAFCVTGTTVVIKAGHGGNPVMSIVLGMFTGVGGGMLRDILTNVTPAIFRKHVYAVAALAGSGTYYLLLKLGVSSAVATVLAMATVCIIRYLATTRRWELPKIRIDP
ncbi:MAG: trimeric intracellular cation channel family protein [Christensenellales bacterium]|jgi:uncharacterized membrane protein YeiH